MATPDTVGVGFLSERIVHLHLSDLCNLACVHCYSNSAPGRQTRLSAPVVVSGLRALHTEGYRTVSLSGGEPLLYKGLPGLIDEMRDIGYRVNVVTNGTVFGSASARDAARRCSFTAVSVDGLQARHDAVRAQPGSFARTTKGLEWLADNGQPFGITTTVTADSLAEVPDVHEWAREAGALLLNLRPLALVGRAAAGMADQVPSATDLSRLLLLSSMLDGMSEMKVHTDVAPVELVSELWADAFADPSRAAGGWRMSDLVNPLIVTEDGRLFPYAYGVADELVLGSIGDVPAAAEGMRARGGEPVVGFLHGARDLLPTAGSVDLPAHLMAASHRHPVDA